MFYFVCCVFGTAKEGTPSNWLGYGIADSRIGERNGPLFTIRLSSEYNLWTVSLELSLESLSSSSLVLGPWTSSEEQQSSSLDLVKEHGITLFAGAELDTINSANRLGSGVLSSRRKTRTRSISELEVHISGIPDEILWHGTQSWDLGLRKIQRAILVEGDTSYKISQL